MGFGLAQAAPQHGYAVWGQLKFPANMPHYPFVNPNAPKAGNMNLDASGSFDSFNNFIIQGTPATGLGLIYDSLLSHSPDEVAAGYCLLCQNINVSDDRKTITFTLRPNIKFSDGSPLTADDVVFTFEQLITKGNPFYKSYYGDVVGYKAIGADKVEFTSKNPENRELPLILGEFAIVQKKFFEKTDFAKPFLDIPIGSGPYKIKEFIAGKYIIYELNPEYWGQGLPINRGRNNIATLKYDYFRDRNIALEAFKSGQLDYREENSARHWATAYNIPAVKNGQIVKNDVNNGRVAALQAIYFNTRKPLWQNRNLRMAMQYLWDYEWVQKNIMYGAYQRTQSLAENSTLAARQKISKEELAILQPHQKDLPAEVFNEIYQAPKTDGSGNNRENLKRAREILERDGWVIDPKTKLLSKNGQALQFEILLNNDDLAPHIQPFVQSLERIGGRASLKVQETTTWIKSVEKHDYDVVILARGNSESPGNELREYWGSKGIINEGNENFAGINSPIVDELIEKIIKSKNYDELTTRFRALDRVIMFGYYFIPMYYAGKDRIAYWDKYDAPPQPPKDGFSIQYMWYNPDKATKLK